MGIWMPFLARNAGGLRPGRAGQRPPAPQQMRLALRTAQKYPAVQQKSTSAPTRCRSRATEEPDRQVPFSTGSQAVYGGWPVGTSHRAGCGWAESVPWA